MAFYSGFFNSKGLDRTYTAENFCDYLGSLICDGIQDNYGRCFAMTANKLNLLIGSGKAWIQGHYFISDTSYTIDLSKYVDESLPRYVIVGICCNTGESYRNISFEILAGTPATSPAIPRFQNTDTKTYLTLCTVRIESEATEMTVTDYRENTTYCGYVKCILGKCKVTEMQSQLVQLIAEMEDYNNTIAELTNKVDMLQTKVDDLTGDIIETGELGEDIYYVLYSNGRLLLRGTGATYDYEIGKSPFWENENIKNLVVSEGITAIGSSVFERCFNMTSASFPNTLTAIGERAFFMYSQGGLTELTIPASVTTLGEKAFVNQEITSVVLPETLTTLGTYLFMGCTRLTTARVECSEVPGFCFVQCSSLRSLTLSRNVKKVSSHIVNYTYLHELTYEGSLDDWAAVQKMGNWDNNTGQGDPHGLDRVICLDGYMQYDTETREWTEVRE